MQKRWIEWSRVMAAASLLVGGASSARAQHERIVSSVPFAFMVGQTELPAGSYECLQMDAYGVTSTTASPELIDWSVTYNCLPSQ